MTSNSIENNEQNSEDIKLFFYGVRACKRKKNTNFEVKFYYDNETKKQIKKEILDETECMKGNGIEGIIQDAKRISRFQGKLNEGERYETDSNHHHLRKSFEDLLFLKNSMPSSSNDIASFKIKSEYNIEEDCGINTLEKIEFDTSISNDKVLPNLNNITNIKVEDNNDLIKQIENTLIQFKTENFSNKCDDPDCQFLFSLINKFKALNEETKSYVKFEIFTIIQKYINLSFHDEILAAINKGKNDYTHQRYTNTRVIPKISSSKRENMGKYQELQSSTINNPDPLGLLIERKHHIGHNRIINEENSVIPTEEATISRQMDADRIAWRQFQIRQAATKMQTNVERSVQRLVNAEERAAIRRRKNAESAARKRLNESEEETAARRRKDAERIARRRLNETKEQAAIRRQKNAERVAHRRLNESAEETAIRRRKDLERKIQKKMNATENAVIIREMDSQVPGIYETEDEAAIVRNMNTKGIAFGMYEMEVEAAIRKQKNAKSNAYRRRKETEGQAALRRKKNAERAAMRRLNESAEETAIRRQKDAERTAWKRLNETAEETTIRRRRDLERKTWRKLYEEEKAAIIKEIDTRGIVPIICETEGRAAIRKQMDVERIVQNNFFEAENASIIREIDIKGTVPKIYEMENAGIRMFMDVENTVRKTLFDIENATTYKEIDLDIRKMEEQAAIRRQRNAECTAQRRYNETEEQVAIRRQKDAESTARKRSNESEEETAIRRRKNAESAARRRLNETEEQAATRRQKNAECTARKRLNESVEETAIRRRKDLERKAQRKLFDANEKAVIVKTEGC